MKSCLYEFVIYLTQLFNFFFYNIIQFHLLSSLEYPTQLQKSTSSKCCLKQQGNWLNFTIQFSFFCNFRICMVNAVNDYVVLIFIYLSYWILNKSKWLQPSIGAYWWMFFLQFKAMYLTRAVYFVVSLLIFLEPFLSFCYNIVVTIFCFLVNLFSLQGFKATSRES